MKVLQPNSDQISFLYQRFINN